MIYIGKLIHDKRKEKGLTQAWLSEYFKYSETFFSKIECGATPVPPSIINELSRLLECDLNHIYCYSHVFSTYEEYCLYFELKNAILKTRNDLFPEILCKYTFSESILNSATKNELYFMLVYVKALSMIENDKKETIRICCQYLEIDLVQINEIVPMFDREIPVYSLLITALYDTGKHETAYYVSINLYRNLSTHLEINYSHAEQNIDLHNSFINVINNHAHILFSLKRYSESLYFCNEAIQKSIDYRLIGKAKGPYLIKLGNHYFLNQYTEALYCLEQLRFICLHSNNTSFESILETVAAKYPKLFN